MTHQRFRIIILSIVFITIISLPFINDRFKLIKDIENLENRQMALEPEFNINLLDPFPGKYEKYYNDHFNLRSMLVKYYNMIKVVVFKRSPFPDLLIIGKDDWLFNSEKELESYKGKNRLDPLEMDSIKAELEYRAKFLSDRGCKFYFLIVPGKATLYPDKMPYNIYRYNTQTWGQQLIEYLNANSKIKVINIFDVLKAKRVKEQVYYKLDTHWNNLGAFYSFREVLKQINQDFPEVSVVPLSDYNIIPGVRNGGNINDLISNVGKLKDTKYDITPKKGFQAKDVPNKGYPVVEGFPYPDSYEKGKEITGSKKPKILFIVDSFFDFAFPYIAEEFSRSVRIFDSWQYKLNEDIVNSEKPDIVVLQIYEYHLRNILKYQSRFLEKNEYTIIKK